MYQKDQSIAVEGENFIRGEVFHTIYMNEETDFSIVKVKIHETNETYEEQEIVIRGNFPTLKEGMIYTFFGQLERHPKFGQQYYAYSYQTYIPSDKDGLIKYLSSDLFYGVGEKTARRMIQHLGTNIVEKVIQEPNIVMEVKGIPKKTLKTVAETIIAHQGFESIVIHFSKFGIHFSLCQKIFEKYHVEALDVLKENPYKFVFDTDGFSFQMADRIGSHYNVTPDHPQRIQAALVDALKASIQDGHVFLPKDEAIRQTFRRLNIDQIEEDSINSQIKVLHDEGKLIFSNDRVYLPFLYDAEDKLATHVKRILAGDLSYTIDSVHLMKFIGEIEEKEAISYGVEQYEAIEKALQSKMMILTGGPGTGKTTVIQAILYVYAKFHEFPYERNAKDKEEKSPFLLCAPTGRAAKRLSEATGLPALTIHRLLGWNGNDFFEKDESNPLQGKFLIIDEFSMVDVWLAKQLFQAIPDDMQVLLVGDEDQLPSVGPGQVLADFLKSASIPTAQLREVYRQKEGSTIIQLAHDMKRNNVASKQLTKSADFNFIRCRDFQVVDVIESIFVKAKEKEIDLKNIQVLAPMYRTQVGIYEINHRLQEIVNPHDTGKRERVYKNVIYRVGDKVIQLINQPEDGVYNGDIGEIVAIFRAKETKDKVEQIVISFDGKEVIYEQGSYDHFMHAYCISIHKAQGSEFPIVILPIVRDFSRMLRKNLLYTAVTRAKDSLLICGDEKAFLRGIETIDDNKRYTSLLERLENMTDDNEKTPSADLTPYDFMS